jgi:polyhydroxyalkanoate synthesis repressor PhaR
MIVIKKYSNRKLYNTVTKKYITLSEISQLIRSGNEVSVIDNDSGEDITADTLSQIIFMQGKKQKKFLPGSVLVSLIRSRGDRIAGIQKSILDQINLSEKVDEEIKFRVYSLVHQDLLSEDEGSELIEKLIEEAERDKQFHMGIRPKYTVLSEQIERYLTSKNLPTSEDLKILSNRLDQLSERISNL